MMCHSSNFGLMLLAHERVKLAALLVDFLFMLSDDRTDDRCSHAALSCQAMTDQQVDAKAAN